MKPLDFRKWIDEHRHCSSPGGNAQIWEETRTSWSRWWRTERAHRLHVNQARSLLPGGRRHGAAHAQAESASTFPSGRRDLPCSAGHSPLPARRPTTVGLVIERRRLPGEKDFPSGSATAAAASLYRNRSILTDKSSSSSAGFEHYCWATRRTRACRKSAASMRSLDVHTHVLAAGAAGWSPSVWKRTGECGRICARTERCSARSGKLGPGAAAARCRRGGWGAVLSTCP